MGQDNYVTAVTVISELFSTCSGVSLGLLPGEGGADGKKICYSRYGDL